MLKTFKTLRLCRARRAFKDTTMQKRLFLSKAYRCEEAWNRRLESPLLRKIEPARLYMELDQKFTSLGKMSAVDVDIFVNSIVDNLYVDELMKMLHNLRLSTETTNTLDSTHHAVIRYLWQHNFIQDLHEVLNDRLNYGIFPDHFCYNLLMNDFVEKQDFTSAAKTASLVMLQEDAAHPITNALCIYSCHKYLESPSGWMKPEVQEDTSKEEIKIRVRYLRNPFFDDHFDLTDPKDLIGKTLNFQGKHRGDALGRTCQLRGLILYKKYDQVLKLIEEWIKTIQDKVVYEEVFELISKDNSGDQDQASDWKCVEAQLSILKEKQNHKESLTEAIENIIRSAVKDEADNDISKQCQKYLDWEQARTDVLEKQIKAIDREKRIANIQKIKKDLQEKEQLLTFFDREEEIELQIERLEEMERKEDERIHAMHKSAKKLRALVAAESYVPPDVKSKE